MLLNCDVIEILAYRALWKEMIRRSSLEIKSQYLQVDAATGRSQALTVEAPASCSNISSLQTG